MGAVWPTKPATSPGAIDLDQMPAVDHTQGPVDLGQQAGDRGLAGSGVAGEDQVVRRLDRRETAFGAQLLHTEEVGDQVDPGLDLLEPDPFVELGQQLLERSGRAEVGSLRRRVGRPDGLCRRAGPSQGVPRGDRGRPRAGEVPPTAGSAMR